MSFLVKQESNAINFTTLSFVLVPVEEARTSAIHNCNNKYFPTVGNLYFERKFALEKTSQPRNPRLVVVVVGVVLTG